MSVRQVRRRADTAPSPARRAAPRREPGAPPSHAAPPLVALPQLDVSQPDEPSEREADVVADRVVEGRPVPAISPFAPHGARLADESEVRDAPEVAMRTTGPDALDHGADALEQEADALEQEADTLEQGPGVEATALEQGPDVEATALRQAEGPQVVDEEDPARVDRMPEPTEGHEPEAVVQRQETTSVDEDRGPPIARKATPDGGSAAAAAAIARPGSGTPLPAATRAAIEPALGTSLGHVRVHDDAAAREAARGIRARAFTSGSDIWLGPGASPHDVRLMAHEATHVVQQAGGLAADAAPKAQRAANPDPGASPAKDGSDKAKDEVEEDPTNVFTTEYGTVDLREEAKPKVQIKQLCVPHFKLEATGDSLDKLRKPLAKGEKRKSKHIRKWEQGVRDDAENQMKTKVKGAAPVKVKGADVYYLQSDRRVLLVGTIEDLRNKTLRPQWDEQGAYVAHDVDHRREDQLWGKDDPAKDEIENLWLLNAKVNQSVGPRIAHEIRHRLHAVLNSVRSKLGNRTPDAKVVRNLETVSVRQVVGGLPHGDGDPAVHWTADQIRDGAALRSLKVLGPNEIVEQNLEGTYDELALYGSERGVFQIPVKWPEGAQSQATDIPIGQNRSLKLTKVEYNGTSTKDPSGKVTGHVWETDEKQSNKLTGAVVHFPIRPMPGVKFGGYIDTRGLNKKLAASFKGMSPVVWDEADVNPDQGVVARGRVLPTIPLIRDAAIDIVVEGDDVYLEKVFAADDFSFPGPIQVLGSSLTLQVGTKGAAATGRVDFEVAGLGTGWLSGAATADEGTDFALEGEFAFETELFEKAEIRAWYRRGEAGYELGGSGKLAMGRNRVRGVRGATIDATIQGERITAEGNVEVDAPGIRSGTVALVSDPETGVQIAGTLELADDIPGLSGGTVAARVAQNPEGGYSLSGAISADVDVAGVTGRVEGDYEDGAFVAAATLAYDRGRLFGQLYLGATNRQLVDGKPTGAATDRLEAFGRGSLTLRLTDWMQGTAEVEIGPDGALTVAGEISLPNTLDLFPEKRLDRNIFTINLDIPIVGLSVARQNVGIFASVGGGLDARASVGPGQLRNVAVGVVYSPDDESRTEVSGTAEFHVPAYAGLRLSVRGALGAGIPLVDARAGLELGGALGIEGAASIGVEVDWTPTQGLALEGVAAITAQPSFTFDVTGFVEVTFDYYFGTSTLYDKRWKLAAFRYGSGLTLGVRVPVSWREGEPFDLSYNDIELTYPDIDADQLLRGLVRQLA